MLDTRELLVIMKDTVEFLEASEVAQTSVGIAAYIQARNLQKAVALLEAEISEENAYIEQLAERMGY